MARKLNATLPPPRIILKALSEGQKTVIRSIGTNTVTICSGMAGTGKTHLAVTAGLKRLVENAVGRLIVCRPIVDSGEHLGFLPGDIGEKTAPYMAPVFDILDSMVSKETMEFYRTTRMIEVAPLAYMRGRTFHNCFMILDEAQNATPDQIRMFLSRMGNYSQMVMCGDSTQSDIHNSGFASVIEKLEGIDDIGVVRLTAADMARHPLVATMLERLG